MTRDEFQKELIKAGLSPKLVYFDSSHEGSYNLITDFLGARTFFLDRGEVCDEKRFKSESEALVDLLGSLFMLYGKK